MSGDLKRPMRAIDRATRNFRDARGQRESLPVPALDVDGQPPFVVWWKSAWTVAETDLVLPHLARGGLSTEQMCRVLIAKAVDEQGNALFHDADLPELLHESAPRWIIEIVNAMLLSMFASPSVADQKKA